MTDRNMTGRNVSLVSPDIVRAPANPRRSAERGSSRVARPLFGNALSAFTLIDPWTNFVLGPNYGRALPLPPEDRRA